MKEVLAFMAGYEASGPYHSREYEPRKLTTYLIPIEIVGIWTLGIYSYLFLDVYYTNSFFHTLAMVLLAIYCISSIVLLSFSIKEYVSERVDIVDTIEESIVMKFVKAKKAKMCPRLNVID
jgi:hypothetical protein